MPEPTDFVLEVIEPIFKYRIDYIVNGVEPHGGALRLPEVKRACALLRQPGRTQGERKPFRRCPSRCDYRRYSTLNLVLSLSLHAGHLRLMEMTQSVLAPH